MTAVRTPVARTPVHHWEAARKARLVDRDGWQVVAAYGNTAQEAEAARTRVALADVSAAAKFSVRGNGVAAAAERLFPGGGLKARAAAVLPDGAGVACRLHDEHL